MPPDVKLPLPSSRNKHIYRDGGSGSEYCAHTSHFWVQIQIVPSLTGRTNPTEAYTHATLPPPTPHTPHTPRGILPALSRVASDQMCRHAGGKRGRPRGLRGRAQAPLHCHRVLDNPGYPGMPRPRQPWLLMALLVLAGLDRADPGVLAGLVRTVRTCVPAQGVVAIFLTYTSPPTCTFLLRPLLI